MVKLSCTISSSLDNTGLDLNLDLDVDLTDMILTLECFVGTETQLDSLDVTLHALAAPELKQLAKMTRLPAAASQRASITEALLKHSRQKHMGAFLLGGPADAAVGLLKKSALLKRLFIL